LLSTIGLLGTIGRMHWPALPGWADEGVGPSMN